MFLIQFSLRLFVSECCTEASHFLDKCGSRDPLVMVADVSDLSALIVSRKHSDS